VVLGNGHERLGISDLPPELQSLSTSDELPKGSFHDAIKNFKKELVRVALAMHKGNKLKAAKELGISRAYLHRLLNQLEVSDGRDDDREEEADLQEVEAQERALDSAVKSNGNSNGKDALPAVQVRADLPEREVGRAVEPAKAFRSAVRIA
jgi:hypothetical protein